jgi:hypothetical protein
VSWWSGKANGFASCDPSQRPDELELSVDVAGIGNREHALGHLSASPIAAFKPRRWAEIQAYTAGVGSR